MTRLRALLVGLLILWCGAGLAVTAGALADPAAWEPRDGIGVVGTPLRGAAETAVLQTLLADRPPVAGERWLVVFPAGSDALVLTYVRYQLGHQQYPRRVDVATVDALPRTADYAGIITAPGIRLAGPWQATAQHGGFTRHALGTS